MEKTGTTLNKRLREEKGRTTERGKKGGGGRGRESPSSKSMIPVGLQRGRDQQAMDDRQAEKTGTPDPPGEPRMVAGLHILVPKWPRV
jgi:hypothetical protein